MNQIGRYQILGQLGDGGMAVIYRAYDPHFKREVAIKVIKAHFLHDPQFHQRFSREAQVIAMLQHPAIVPVYDFGAQNGQPYLVMALMLGGSLADRLQHGPLLLAEVANLLDRIAPALDLAHQKGIVHRDLKPDNFLFDQQSNPYVADFGIAKLLTDSTMGLSQTGMMIGTPFYMSLEQARGEKDIDGRSDIYSLGAILFELLTGTRPFQADSLAGFVYKHINEPVPDILTRRAGLPIGCQAVIEKAMAKSREARYATVSQMAASFRAVVEGRPNLSGRTSRPTSAPSAPTQLLSNITSAQDAPTGLPFSNATPTPASTVPARAWWQQWPMLASVGALLISAVACLLIIVVAAVTMTGGNGTNTSIPTSVASDNGTSEPGSVVTPDVPTAPLQPAVTDEVLIIVTDFVKEEKGQEETFIYAALDKRVISSELENVRVERLEGVTPHAASEAIATGEQYSATLVIWGIVDEPIIQLNYEIVGHEEAIKEQAQLGATSAVDSPTFSASVVKGAATESEYVTLFSLGQIAYFEEEYEEAVRLFDEALKLDLDPERTNELNVATAYMYRGYAKSFLEDYEEALADVNSALEIDPQFARAFNFRGYIYDSQDKPEEALAEYEMAIELDPEYGTPYNNIGIYYKDQNDYETALSYYNKAIEADPEQTRAYRNKGEAHYQLGELEEALAAYNQAIEIEPEEAENYNARGNHYHDDLKDYNPALEDYSKAIELDSDPIYYRNRAITYTELGEYDAAMADYEQAIELDPEYVWAYTGQASLYEKLEDYEAALAAYNQAIEIDPEEAGTYHARGYYYYNRKDYDAAIKDYTKAAEKGNAGAQNNLGIMYQGGEGVEQDYAEAVRWYRLAAEQKEPYAQNNLGLMYENGYGVEQDDTEAVRWYRLAAEQGHEGAQVHLAKIYEQGIGVIQDYDEAMSWYRKAANQKNELSLGVVYEEGIGVPQDLTEAASWYRKAANKGNKDAMNKLATMYEEGRGVPKDPDEAERWKLNTEYNAKRFTISCLVEGEEEKKPFHIYLLEHPSDKENPLAEEEERLLRDHRATIPEDVVESFAKLYTIAQEHDTPFLELVVYALENADKDSEEKE